MASAPNIPPSLTSERPSGHASRNGHTVGGLGSTVTPEPYHSSGGASERRPYEDGEQLLVELHRKSFSVLWSASVPATYFMRQVAALTAAPDAGYASLSPSDEDEGRYSFLDALAQIENGSVSADFIRLDFSDRAFTWEAPDFDASQGEIPDTPGEVGMISTEFTADLLRDLIQSTATPHVAADIEGILASTQRLTSDFVPASK